MWKIFDKKNKMCVSRRGIRFAIIQFLFEFSLVIFVSFYDTLVSISYENNEENNALQLGGEEGI